MFYLVSLLFFIISILIYQVNSNLHPLEYFTIIILLFIILTYLFYLDRMKKEEFKDVMQDSKSIVQKNQEEQEEQEEEKTNANNVKTKLEKSEIDTEDYIPLSQWEKLSQIPKRLNQDILPHIKELAKKQKTKKETNNAQDERNSIMKYFEDNEKNNNDNSIDPYYVYRPEKQNIYFKLGVIMKKPKKNKKVNLNNIDTLKMQNISNQAEKINQVLLTLKKHAFPTYKKLLETQK